MVESLSTELNVLSAKIDTKTTVSSNSPKNFTQSPNLPISCYVILHSNLVLAANDDMKLPPVRNSASITSLTHCMESPMPEVIPTRLVSESTGPKLHSVPTPCLRDPQIN
ncbi:unnamed protein product [Hymenolepis diminuta]|uniref:Uncharacterized protein n=1 Tax=Hymenolepis diminuta TaxID=6216 RepID=A0A564YR06_HYMDI|nr:unnamed protein product [Hymenolepis diminuta]